MPRASACSPEEWAWLEARYPSTPAAALLDAFEAEFGRRPNKGTVCAHMADRGILRQGLGRIEWDDEMDAFLREAVPGRSAREAADAFERRFGIRLTRAQLKGAKARLGVKSGVNPGRFEPGREPRSKGVSWDEQGIPPESRERMRAGQFKPGVLPRSGADIPIGAERTDRDGYVMVKTAWRPSRRHANDNWTAKHRLVWERANGRAVPEGFLVAFADRDVRNFDPANLVAVPKGLWSIVQRKDIPYWDAESLAAALNVARLHAAANAAMKRPRPCRLCGRGFAPRFAGQRTCDACLGREAPPPSGMPEACQKNAPAETVAGTGYPQMAGGNEGSRGRSGHENK